MTEESANVRAPELTGGGSYELTLSTGTPGLTVYAYTFVSCVVA